jgi:hypothetical protein
MSRRASNIDWAKEKSDYVNDPTLRLEDIARRNKCALGTVQSRAAREKWTDAREARSNLLQQSATRKNVSAAVQELAKYNEQDIQAAKMLRACAMRKLQDAQKKLTKPGSENDQLDLESAEIRSLASAVESAQRIARLALGASTENSGGPTLIDPTMPDMEHLSDDELTDVEQGAAALQRLLAKSASNGSSNKASSGSTKVQ